MAKIFHIPIWTKRYGYISKQSFLSHNITTKFHHHPCVQCVVSLQDTPITLKTPCGEISSYGFIIKPNVVHELDSTNVLCLSMLVDPIDPQYHFFNHLIKDHDVYQINRDEAMRLKTYLRNCLFTNSEIDIPLFCSILGDVSQCSCTYDKRIFEAAAIIALLPIKRISSSDLANKIYLSESRFLHLFRTQLGINFRNYLLWLRLCDAMKTLHTSHSLTSLANDSGFADSAHFSRTCMTMHGLRPSDLKKASQQQDIPYGHNNKADYFYRLFK